MTRTVSTDQPPAKVARVTVLTGPSGSGKTAQLLARYRLALAHQPPGVALWLAPTRRAVQQLRDRLLNDELPGVLSPNIVTFGQFAEAILARTATPMRFLGAWAKRQLVARLLAQANTEKRLDHFRPIADRPGLVDLCTQFISELKRLEIWPEDFRKACQQRGLQDKDRELLDLYEAYQLQLTAHHLYDAEGRFWSARDLLQKGARPPYDRLQLVVADGFADFTRTEHEILAILAQRVEELHVTLPLEPGNGRTDLFAKPRQTLDRLRRLGAVEEVAKRPAKPRWPALAHVEQELFKNPKDVRKASESTGIEIRIAARVLGEVERIGREIKTLLVEGDPATRERVRPGDVTVVYRSLSAAAPLVREVFTELGLPFAIEAAEPLGQSRLLVALVNVLQLAREDWPFDRLLTLVTSAYFKPDWPAWQAADAAMSTELAIRDLQVASGREYLLEQIERRASEDLLQPVPATDDDFQQERQRQRERRQQRARIALAVLKPLEQALESLSARATSSEWGRTLAAVAGELGLLKARDIKDAAAQRDWAAWDQLMRLLGSADHLWHDLGQPPPELDATQFQQVLLDLLQLESIPGSADETGCVRVLSAPSARALSIPYLFFAGLSEKAFPPPDREDRMYGEAEYQVLTQYDLPFVLRAERSQEEMLLFYEVLTRATKRLYLSYPGLDEKAQALLPSPYLAEVERILDVPAAREMPDLSPLPSGDVPHGACERRLLAVAQALDQRDGLLAGLCQDPQTQPLAENIAAALKTVRARGRSEGFGPWEGILPGAGVQTTLSGRFGPAHRWSPSDLERYGYCPFQFLAAKVLRLEPLPELELETDFMTRGSRLHATLARLHRNIVELESSARSPAALDEAVYQRLADEAVAEVFSRAWQSPIDRAMAEIDRRLVARWLAGYRQQHAAYDESMRELNLTAEPAHFEVSFGLKPPASDPLSTVEPLKLTIDDEEVLIAGRIDRVDLGRLGQQIWFTVLDYKTGRGTGYTSKAVRSGDALQLPLYALAVQDLLLASQHAVPWHAGYWFVSDKGYRQMLDLYEPGEGRWQASDTWRDLRPRLLARVAELVKGIRGGDFPVACRDEQCTSRCEYHTVCRIHQIRALEKTWPSQPRT